MEDRTYTCECGKIFTKPNSFNGHKSHCVVHLSATGRLQLKLKSEDRRLAKSAASNRKRVADYKQQRLDLWISEKHTCARCGKVMTEKYGSGRFCSKACANSHNRTEESRQQLSQIMKQLNGPKRLQARLRAHEMYQQRISDYNQNPRHCVICTQLLTYKQRNYQTCSRHCQHILFSQQHRSLVQLKSGNLNPHPDKNCKSGTYKGIHCDSSWELAFVAYHLDRGISVERCRQSFPYMWEGKEHLYFPDFIVGGTYIEIKGHWTKKVQAKIDAFPKDLPYRILYKEEMKKYITYCKEVYGAEFWNTLYT